MRLLTLTIATLALMAPIASANAAPPVRAGILQCQGGQNVGFVVGSVTSLECVFRAKAAGLNPTSPSVQPHRPRSRRHRADPVVLGRQCAEQPARARRTRRQLWRRRRQCIDRHRRRRQLPGGRSRQCLRAAAAQRAGPDRAERRRRHRRPRTAAGRVRPAPAPPSPASPSRLTATWISGKGPRKRAFFCFDVCGMPASRQIWHGHRCCGIEPASAAGAARFSSLCSHHIFSAGDFFMRRFLILAAAALATLAASIVGASAQQPMQRVQVGILECRGGASVGFIVGSVTNLGCVLRAEGMPEDRYIATIRKVGLDLGITQELALAWGVYRAGGAARAGRPLRQLCRRAGQRHARRRRWRQRAGRRLRQLDRVAAAERAGPGRRQRCCRTGKPGTAAGTVALSRHRERSEQSTRISVRSHGLLAGCPLPAPASMKHELQSSDCVPAKPGWL